MANSTASPFEVDAQLGVAAVFLSAPRKHLAFVKLMLESYEGLGVARSEEPFYGDGRALLVFLLAPDFFADADRLLTHLESAIELRREPADPGRLAALRKDLLDELI